jgi:hypothetical protein
MFIRTLMISVCAALLAACQPAPAPKPDAPVPKQAAVEAAPISGEDASMPANWIEADGPGAASITVEDQGQRVSLECSAKGSEAAGAPGKLVVSATWRPEEAPPKAQDVALILEGAGYRAPPLWEKDNGRDRVSIQLEPTPELIAALQRQGVLRVVAGDWFLSVADDPKGAPKRFAETCAAFAKSP